MVWLSRERERSACNLRAAMQRGDLWMAKSLYLSYVLKSLGHDFDWVLDCKEKEVIYNKLEEGINERNLL